MPHSLTSSSPSRFNLMHDDKTSHQESGAEPMNQGGFTIRSRRRKEAEPDLQSRIRLLTSAATNRWLVAVAGIVMQIALGAVYAWSVFRIPLTQAYGWSIPQVTRTFELAILTLGFAAFAGGLWMKSAGPRRLAVIGGLA